MIYPIVAYGTSVLKKKAQDIAQDGEIDVKQLSEDMFETMYTADGVGLAAPQIGKSIRIFVVDGTLMMENKEPFKKVFINAEILEETGEEVTFEEGCLSIPHIREDIKRPSKIKIRYFDTDWQEHEEEYDGFQARVIQHEYDHIEGILFTDLVSSFKKRLLKGRLAKIMKGQVRTSYRMKFPLASKKR